MTTARKLAQGHGIEFWLIGAEVYRVVGTYVLDIYGLPQSRRWECSLVHWERYRRIYDWVKDV